MRSACFFVAYFQKKDIPYYITIYLTELKKHFTEVYFLTTQRDLSDSSNNFLKKLGVEMLTEKNEGFDFGQWYKAFQKIDIEAFDEIALVNDSCILFKPLDEFIAWANSDNADMQGMTYSEAIAPHLQSYFLIINKPIIKRIKVFFEEHKIVQDIKDVIRTYEVGLSTFLVSNGFRISAYMNESGSSGEFSPYYSHVKEHLKRGIPLIKKKILFSSYRKEELFTLARMNFDINVGNYIKLIEEQSWNLILSPKTLLQSEENRMNWLTKLKYNSLKLLIQLYRKLRHAG